MLHGLMHRHFDEEEIRTLCFDLGIVYDDLTGAGLDDRIRELLLQLERESGLWRLLERVMELRPGVDWPLM